MGLEQLCVCVCVLGVWIYVGVCVRVCVRVFAQGCWRGFTSRRWGGRHPAGGNMNSRTYGTARRGQCLGLRMQCKHTHNAKGQRAVSRASKSKSTHSCTIAQSICAPGSPIIAWPPKRPTTHKGHRDSRHRGQGRWEWMAAGEGGSARRHPHRFAASTWGGRCVGGWVCPDL